jgi:hypothetical protein
MSVIADIMRLTGKRQWPRIGMVGTPMSKDAEPDRSPELGTADELITAGIESVREAVQREDWHQLGDALAELAAEAIANSEALNEALLSQVEDAARHADDSLQQMALQMTLGTLGRLAFGTIAVHVNRVKLGSPEELPALLPGQPFSAH